VRESGDSRLGRPVDARPCRRITAEDGADRHDAPRSGGNHGTGSRTTTEEGAVEVDADNLAIRFIAHLGDQATTTDTGIGHKEIEATKLRDGRLNQGIDLPWIAHIADSGIGATAQSRRSVRNNLINVGHGHGHAVAKQTPGDVQTQPPRGPGHDGHASRRRVFGMHFGR
jgi:hypothetical protein